jgi:hypothetical protein
MTYMAYPSEAGTGPRRLPWAVRAAIAVTVTLAGALGAFSSGFMALLQLGGFATKPWQLWFSLYTAGTIASLAVPAVVWWFLLPRVRWWGVGAMAAALALYILLILSQ